ncbi:MAG: AAA family ATPase [Deltaproteobacteria bacterium]|nr:AAA family ATPase [Deltaproteobacteria bacterium]
MKLTHVRVTKYRCIEDSGLVAIEPEITALIGRNESGKTAFLEALRRLNPADGARFEVTADYPRPQLAAYRRRHERNPDTVIATRLELHDEDVREVERRFGKGILQNRVIEVRRDYKGQLQVEMPVAEHLVIQQVVAKRQDLDDEARLATEGVPTFRELATRMEAHAERSRGAAVLMQVARQLEGSPLQTRIWNETLAARLPRFVSFGEEDVMPGAIGLDRLSDPLARHEPGTATVLALLDLAGVEPADLHPDNQSYEELKARIEASALSVTDELVTYWSHDKDLEVAIDVAPAGPHDVGFEPGTPVLRVRVGHKKTRASLPLGERSRGFAWFFSFLVRLCQLGEYASPLVILLDEPGLSLHAGTQTDFLRFLEERLGPGHQVVYTTHSPFMLDVARLERARGVTMVPGRGTTIAADLSQIDADTLKPLRAALGAAFAETVLGSRPQGPTVVVSDAVDLLWLRFMSSECERRKRTGLDPRFQILPLGAGAALMPYALLNDAPGRKLVLLVDGALDAASRDKIVRFARSPLARSFRLVAVADFAQNNEGVPTLEDLVEIPTWLSLVTEAFKLSPPMSEDELGPTGAIIQRTVKGLEGSGETLDRLRVVETALKRAGTPLPPAMVDRFARLFEALNATLG